MGQVRDLKAAREEIARMRLIVPDLTLDNPKLPDMLARKL